MKYTRKEMREMMEVRGYSSKTIKIYIDQILYLTRYSGKAPHTLTPEDIFKYQVYLVNEKQASWSSFNQAVCAMRFFLTMWLEMTGLSNIFPIRKSIKHFRLF